MAFLILGYCIDNELKKLAVMVDCPSRYASQQVSKSASQQVSKSASQQVSKSASQQVSKSASQQVSKSACCLLHWQC
ncbi:hypothetical protein [Alteromonas sp. OM2203]|uniref:hypothetical protein n=1 Tax=Alteromonas sp. OM2203 TaxID=3398817 RepID=UPI003AF3A640